MFQYNFTETSGKMDLTWTLYQIDLLWDSNVFIYYKVRQLTKKV